MTRRRSTSGRRPTSSELALWRNVARTAQPLRPEKTTPETNPGSSLDETAARNAPEPEPKASAKPNGAAGSLDRPSRPTSHPPPAQPSTTVNRRPSYVARLSPNAPGLDGNTARRLKQGRLEPDARIDLHGMTADRAHRALNQFILSSFAMGRRCVLVITGKGGRRRDYEEHSIRAYDDGFGVLKTLAPEWLASSPLSQVVVGVFQAHIRHGGEGALYVYLRKPPKGRRGYSE